MLISRCWLAPHLPTLLVDEHRGHRTPMVQALSREAERLREERPEAAVVLSTRWRSNGPFHVDTGRRHRTLTDYADLGVEVRYDCDGDPGLASALVEAGRRAGVHVGPAQRGVDSGVSVPMRFLAPARDLRLVPLSVADRDPGECRAWGRVIREVLAARPERVAFIVGGMLSHAEHAWNFRREVPQAVALDEHVLDALARGAWSEVHARDGKLAEKAQPDAGLLHLDVLRGFLDEDVAGKVVCYDPEPGMGSALVAFDLPDVESPATGQADEVGKDWRAMRAVDRRGLPPRRERRVGPKPTPRERLARRERPGSPARVRGGEQRRPRPGSEARVPGGEQRRPRPGSEARVPGGEQRRPRPGSEARVPGGEQRRPRPDSERRVRGGDERRPRLRSGPRVQGGEERRPRRIRTDTPQAGATNQRSNRRSRTKPIVGSRTPRPRGRAPTPRPDRKRRG